MPAAAAATGSKLGVPYYPTATYRTDIVTSKRNPVEHSFSDVGRYFSVAPPAASADAAPASGSSEKKGAKGGAGGASGAAADPLFPGGVPSALDTEFAGA